MKFRSKMVFAYTTVALIISLILGIAVARISFQYETTSQKNNLRVSAKSYVTQMDERLSRMDAIMHYILSDATLLESIHWLAEEPKGDASNRYVLDAKSYLSIGLTTEYIMKNSYRTVFFNQESFLASSAIYTTGAGNPAKHRLISEFEVEEIPYLNPVIEADGESVIVTEHLDYWSSSENVPVYSLMKALRGSGMGFLEVENRMDSLDLLERSDPDIDFLILVNGGELLYASDKEYGIELEESDIEWIRNLEEDTVLTENGAIYTKASSTDFDLKVLAYKKVHCLEKKEVSYFPFLFWQHLRHLA